MMALFAHICIVCDNSSGDMVIENSSQLPWTAQNTWYRKIKAIYKVQTKQFKIILL